MHLKCLEVKCFSRQSCKLDIYGLVLYLMYIVANFEVKLNTEQVVLSVEINCHSRPNSATLEINVISLQTCQSSFILGSAVSIQ